MRGHWRPIWGRLLGLTLLAAVLTACLTVSALAEESLTGDAPMENAVTEEAFVKDTPTENAVTEEALVKDAPAESAVTEESVMAAVPAEKAVSGWRQENGEWVYYRDGQQYTGWLEYNGSLYYLTPAMISGGCYSLPCKEEGTDGQYKDYLFREDGRLLTGSGWLEYTWTDEDGESRTDWIYLDEGDSLHMGWVKSYGKWYYLDPWMYADGLFEIDGKNYLFDGNGTMFDAVTGWGRRTWTEDGGSRTAWYYGTGGGGLKTGWLLTGGKWYYLDPWMYADGLFGIDGANYLFDGSGAMFDAVTGWGQRTWTEDGGSRTAWYYGTGGGGLKTGWLQDGGKWYYLDPWMYADGLYQIDGANYLFDGSGAMFDAVTGWGQRTWTEDGRSRTAWYYGTGGGGLKTGWLQDGGKWYYLDPWMVQGDQRWINGTRYFFRENGTLITDGWAADTVEYSNGVKNVTWYYTDSDGAMRTGWVKSYGQWYYLRPEMCAGGAFEIDGAYYYFDENGTMLTVPKGWKALEMPGSDRFEYIYGNGGDTLYTGWLKEGNRWYYLRPEMCRGTWYIDGANYYFDENGVMTTASGWVSQTDDEEGTKWYYANGDGTLKEGWLKSGGKWYYLNPTMLTGGHLIDGKWYFFDDNGAMATTGGWKRHTYKNGGMTFTEWYYANADGTLREGWLQSGGRRYYLGPEMYRGGWEIGGKWYFFDEDGVMATTGGWKSYTQQYYDGAVTSWYYAGPDGTLQMGWVKSYGRWYYLDPWMYTGSWRVDGEQYFFDENGSLANREGWHSIPNDHGGRDWYYTNADGTVRTGWLQSGGQWYYLEEDGRMLSDTTRVISGELCTFNSDGAWVA